MFGRIRESIAERLDDFRESVRERASSIRDSVLDTFSSAAESVRGAFGRSGRDDILEEEGEEGGKSGRTWEPSELDRPSVSTFDAEIDGELEILYDDLAHLIDGLDLDIDQIYELLERGFTVEDLALVNPWSDSGGKLRYIFDSLGDAVSWIIEIGAPSYFEIALDSGFEIWEIDN